MNAQLKQQIDEKLEHLSEQYVADTYLSGVEQMLSEWSDAADEAAYRDL
jgi:hypothetical protein